MSPPIVTLPAVATVGYRAFTSNGITTTLTAPDAPDARVPSVWLPDAPGGRIQMDTEVEVGRAATTIRATFRSTGTGDGSNVDESR